MPESDLPLIAIVEDEEAVREGVRAALGGVESYILRFAEHMQQAREMLSDARAWNRIALIVMDIMLPKNAADAQQIKGLIVEREKAYDDWIVLEQDSVSNTDSRWLKARFAVDSFDKRIFAVLDAEGGIRLIQECFEQYGVGSPLRKPVLYLTARENEFACRKGMGLVMPGKAHWLVKPATPRQILSVVRQLLQKGSRG